MALRERATKSPGIVTATPDKQPLVVQLDIQPQATSINMTPSGYEVSGSVCIDISLV